MHHSSIRSLLVAAGTCAAMFITTDAISQETPIRVMGIVVKGNATTRASVILRELIFEEQDTLPRNAFYPALERSRQNLLNTGLFNTVTLMPVYVSKTEALVEVNVNERWYWWPAPILEVADPNFNTWWRTRDPERLNLGFYMYRYNFRGRNETVYAKAQFGYAQQYGLFYKVPFIDKAQRWGVLVGGGYYQQHEITVGTVGNERVFFSPIKGNARTQWNVVSEATLRRGHDVRHTFGLKYTQVNIDAPVAQQFPDHLGDAAQTSSYLSLSYTFTWDQRDRRTFTLNGRFADAKLTRYGLGLLSINAPDITTLQCSFMQWVPLAPKWTASLSLRGKTTIGPPVPYFVQEGLGYQHYIRGYEYYVLDGQHYGLSKLNVMFQLLAPRTRRLEFIPLEPFRTLQLAIYLNGFLDAGYVVDQRYAAANPLSNRLGSGYGLGLDLVTSYDQIVRGEYTWNALGEHGFFLHFTYPF